MTHNALWNERGDRKEHARLLIHSDTRALPVVVVSSRNCEQRDGKTRNIIKRYYPTLLKSGPEGIKTIKKIISDRRVKPQSNNL